jgi:hypothetical protein
MNPAMKKTAACILEVWFLLRGQCRHVVEIYFSFAGENSNLPSGRFSSRGQFG